MNKIARFRLDPRDARTDAEFYDVVGDDSGVFDCMTLLTLSRRLSERSAFADTTDVSAPGDAAAGVQRP